MTARRVRLLIDDPTQQALIHEFHRDVGSLPWIDYPQMYCWLIQCIVDQINIDIPWHEGACEEVVVEMEAILSETFIEVHYEDEPDHASFVKACARVRNIIEALMATNAYRDLRDTIDDCMSNYNYNSLNLLEVEYTMAKITLELVV